LARDINEISIIIPVLNEGDTINSTIDHIRGLAGGKEAEIIVVDCDPDGSTLKVIGDTSVVKVMSRRGRSFQMNQGVEETRGGLLIFLHADTLLPESGLISVKEILSEMGAYGAFKLSFDESNPYLKLVAWLDNKRVRITRIPYGDQAIFMRRSDFNDLGGYKEIMILEDADLSRRAKRAGLRFRLDDESVTTSSRRFQDDGYLRHSLRYFLLMAMFNTGIGLDRLERFYHRDRK